MKVNKAVRLWIFWNGYWVRIRVGGEPVRLAWYREFEDEGGFEREEVTYTLDGDQVMRKTHHVARDCEGPMGWFEYRTTKRDQLAAVEVPDPDVKTPAWERVDGFIDQWGNLQPWYPVGEAC